jgi:hypothetical protein
VVRRAVGCLRYDTEQERLILNELYRHLRLYTNFFQPTMKLIGKTRAAARLQRDKTRLKLPTGESLHRLT